MPWSALWKKRIKWSEGRAGEETGGKVRCYGPGPEEARAGILNIRVLGSTIVKGEGAAGELRRLLSCGTGRLELSGI